MAFELELKVTEALAEDVGKGLARLDPEDMKALNLVLGDVIEISGAKNTVARITGTLPEHRGKKVIQIDGITRSNAKSNLGEVVRVKRLPRTTATTIIVTPLDFSTVLPDESELDQFAKILQGLAVVAGDKINIPFLGRKGAVLPGGSDVPPGWGDHQPEDEVCPKETRFFPGSTFPCLLRGCRRARA